MLVKSPPSVSTTEGDGGGNNDAAVRVYKRYKLSDEKVCKSMLSYIHTTNITLESKAYQIIISFLLHFRLLNAYSSERKKCY